MHNDRKQFPFWLGGALVALVMILISMRGGGTGAQSLVQRFAPRPTDPAAPTAAPFQLPQIHLPSLPPEAQQRLNALRDRFVSGAAIPALTPVAVGPRVRVEVADVKHVDGAVQIRGSISNVAAAPLRIPAAAFAFRDSTGALYATTGSDATALQPGETTSFDLSVPLPSERGLTLIVHLPPDPPLEQVLIVETRS